MIFLLVNYDLNRFYDRIKIIIIIIIKMRIV